VLASGVMQGWLNLGQSDTFKAVWSEATKKYGLA
jgi:hypothetical protein